MTLPFLLVLWTVPLEISSLDPLYTAYLFSVKDEALCTRGPALELPHVPSFLGHLSSSSSSAALVQPRSPDKRRRAFSRGNSPNPYVLCRTEAVSAARGS